MLKFRMGIFNRKRLKAKKKEQEINIPCSLGRYKCNITLIDTSDYTCVKYVYQVITCLSTSLT